MNLETEQAEVDQISSRLKLLEASVEKETAELAKCDKTLKRTQDAQEILQLLAQAVQQKAHERIAKVVSSCLSSVFGPSAYTFHIAFERKRGKTEASLRFVRKDLDLDPLTSSGGGVVDVAALALRVACLVLHRPRLSRILILDEPMRFVSAQYRENVREMFEQLSRDMNIQFIFVTHEQEYACGKVIEL